MRRTAALAAVLLAACAETPAPLHVLRGTTMGTTYTIKYVGEREPGETGRDVLATLDAANKLFSTYDQESEISRFNDQRVTEPVEVEQSFWALCRHAMDVAIRTDGAFDPTMLPLVNLYGFGPVGERRVPSEVEIDSTLPWVGHDKLEVLEDGRLRKSIPGLALDLSGIAKGWGVDAVAALLESRGIASYMVEIGGEVRCAGEKAGGEPWVIGIEGPGGEPQSNVIEKVELRGASLATSGSYRNFVREGERVLHHIFDPRTGRNPSNGVVSVSVRAETCALADALATAFMVLGPERAAEVLERFPGVSALFLLRDGEKDVTVRKVRWR